MNRTHSRVAPGRQPGVDVPQDLTVLAPDRSITVIDGVLRGAPSSRATSAGELLELDVVSSAEGRSVACTVLLEPDRIDVPALDDGDRVLVIGTTRRRFFRSGGATATRTEVVADVVVPWQDRRRLARRAGRRGGVGGAAAPGATRPALAPPDQVREASKIDWIVASSAALNSASLWWALSFSVSAREKLAITPWLAASFWLASSTL